MATLNQMLRISHHFRDKDGGGYLVALRVGWQHQGSHWIMAPNKAAAFRELAHTVPCNCAECEEADK